MKPIDDLNFWKQRIEEAKTRGDRFSVYHSPEGLWKRIEQDHAEIIAQVTSPWDNILDAGCGYGRLSEVINNYTGVDFSEDFIAWAKEKYPDEKFIQANLKELPFKDQEFDWAICSSIRTMVINNLGEEEWNKMLKELKRVATKVLILEYEESKPYSVL